MARRSRKGKEVRELCRERCNIAITTLTWFRRKLRAATTIRTRHWSLRNNLTYIGSRTNFRKKQNRLTKNGALHRGTKVTIIPLYRRKKEAPLIFRLRTNRHNSPIVLISPLKAYLTLEGIRNKKDRTRARLLRRINFTTLTVLRT